MPEGELAEAPRPTVNPSGAPAGLGSHLPALDGLRGLAILFVLIFHLKPTVPITTSTALWVARIPEALWCGVDLFFVLSGFLITGILYDAKGAPAYFRTFYARRVLRIFPLYYGVLVGLFFLYPMWDKAPSEAFHHVADKQGWLWLYSANVRMFLTGEWGFAKDLWHLNHFWSLAVEEHFYLVWPLAVFLLDRRWLMALSACCLVAAPALRAYCVWQDYNFVCAYTFTPCRMDALALGGLLALWARGPQGLSGLKKWAMATTGIYALIIIALFVWRRGLPIEDWVMQTAGYSILAFFFASLLVLAVAGSRGNLVVRVARLSWLRFLGKYSYGLYVFHGLFLPHLHQLPTKGLADRTGSVFVAATIITLVGITASILLALFSWHLFEKHFLKLKRFFEYQQ